MKGIYFTEQALGSLEEILSFLSCTMHEDAVLRVRDKIIAQIETLQQHPYKGQQEEYLKHIELGHRRLIADRYKIIYRILEKSIYITDIFDTRQDPSKMYPTAFSKT